tara:strand:- start:22645 stop:23118 length:474 start_codon:yes stop_codon:yes gene_type:complete
MVDRRAKSPWGMIQAIAAVVALSFSLSVGVYTKVVSDVMSEVGALASEERLTRERLIRTAVTTLEKKVDIKIAKVSGDLDGLEDVINDIELEIAVIQGQQIADEEVRKLVHQVNESLFVLKGDVKALKENSVDVQGIASQLGALSSKISAIQSKLEM